MRAERWEHGSDFHWAVPSLFPEGAPGWPRDAMRFGSGRDGLRWLLERGRDTLGWKRVWVPSYFCQAVVRAMEEGGLPLRGYVDMPGAARAGPENAVPGDVILRHNHFALTAGSWPDPGRGIAIIEDHSHDPIAESSRRSQADFVVVSLRKTLPVPDGGLLWSPKGHAVGESPPVSAIRLRASGDRLAAMMLKSLYLEGHAVEKATFRMLFERGERDIAGGPPSGMTQWTAEMLRMLPVCEWRRKRTANFDFLASALGGSQHFSVLLPEAGAHPFMLVLRFESSAVRDRARRYLIDHSVYPAILWSLESPRLEVDERAVDLSRRVLALHCDFRYEEEDLQRVADEVRNAVREGAA